MDKTTHELIEEIHSLRRTVACLYEGLDEYWETLPQNQPLLHFAQKIIEQSKVQGYMDPDQYDALPEKGTDLLAEITRLKAAADKAHEGFVLAMAQCDLTWSVAVKGQGKENPDKAQYQKNQSRLNELWAAVANLLPVE